MPDSSIDSVDAAASSFIKNFDKKQKWAVWKTADNVKILTNELISRKGFTIRPALAKESKKPIIAKVIDTKYSEEKLKLANEHGIYVKMKHTEGFAKVYFYGNVDGKNYLALALELLGPSMTDMFSKFPAAFNLKNVCTLAQDCINRLESLHSAEIIHRAICPDHIIRGPTNCKNTIYLIDFGIAKQGIVKKKKSKHLEGLAVHRDRLDFVSLRLHSNKEEHKRDDLESLAYCLVYWMRGGMLPWTDRIYKDFKDQVVTIRDLKEHLDISDLPKGFSDFLKYTKKLKRSDKIDYDKCKNMFAKTVEEKKLENNLVLDWSTKK